MTIQERIVSGVAIVSINGRVTLTDGTTEFDDTMQRLIQEGNVRVVLDFAEVPYIDSTALGTIRVRTRPSRAAAARSSCCASRVTCGSCWSSRDCCRVFEAFDSEADAIASVSATPPRAV